MPANLEGCWHWCCSEISGVHEHETPPERCEFCIEAIGEVGKAKMARALEIAQNKKRSN
jgi:hypothetical protein